MTADPLAVENLAVEAWHAFAEPYRASFVKTTVMTTDGTPGAENYYMPETGEKLADVLERIEPRGHNRIVIVTQMGGTLYDDVLGFPTTTTWKVVVAADKAGENYAISACDGIAAPWVGKFTGVLIADMMAALHEPEDIDKELAELLS